MIEGARGGQSFLQVGKPDMEEQMMKLQPVLEKLRSLDPKTFGLLNNMMDQAQATSLLQLPGPMLEKIAPMLDKLKALDPKTAAMISKMVGGASFLQTSMDPEEKMMTLDPKTFGMLNNMISSAEGGHSFLQVQKP